MLKGGGGELRGKLSLAGPPSDAASAGNRIKKPVLSIITVTDSGSLGQTRNETLDMTLFA